MQLNNLKPIHKNKTAKRIGRGGKRGTYSGKGIKGQTSRAGANIRPEIRDLIKKLPKRRGVYFKSILTKPQTVRLIDLENKFETGAAINPQAMLKTGLICLRKGRLPKVKILGGGEVTKKFFVGGCLVSKSVKEKIVKAGGEVK